MGKRWCDWQMDDEALRRCFDRSRKAFPDGKLRIYTVLDHVSQSGMTRHISAFVPVMNSCNGKEYPDICCVAREKKVGGCGMDMGFHLAYTMFCRAYPDGDYAVEMNHSWL